MSAPEEFDRLLVVLVSTRNPLNMGAAARAMSNFGCLRLRVVNPYDPAFREARSAVGASSVMEEAEQFASVADAVADCTLVVGTTATGKRELQHSFRSLDEGATMIRERMRSGKVALLFGSEKTGLSSKDLSHCHWLMHIPTRVEHLSMNLGQAVAVCLYEIARERDIAAATNEARAEQASVSEVHATVSEGHATASEVERMTGVLLDALHRSEYIRESAPVDVEDRVRRLIRRMNMRASDADVWLGMLRQIAWKLRSERQ